jgi:thermitase
VNKSIIAGIVGALFVAGALMDTVHAQSGADRQQATGRVLVKPRAGLPLAALDAILKSAGAERSEVLSRIDVHIVRVPPGREATVAQALARNPHITFAEVDALVPPDDPGLSNQWYVPKIGASSAWSAGASGADIMLAVCDTGVLSTHPDLAGRIVLPGFNTVDGTSNSEPYHGHGTKVAGTIAMTGGNNIGGKGVAFGGTVLPVRVSNRSDGSASVSDIAKCITHAADRGARGANASYGVCGSSTIVSAANYMRSRNGVVTISAGNSGTQLSYAPSSSLTCVSATDSSDRMTSWSSYGSYVDVAAPGSSIYTTDMNGGYSYASGTSFSAPITLGVYGLMMSANPALTPADLDRILFETARDFGESGYDMYYGWGRIDAAAAVSRAAGGSSSAPGPDVTNPSVSIATPAGGAYVRGLVPVNVNATDDVGVTKAELHAAGTLIGTDLSSPYQFTVDTSGRPDGPLELRAIAYDAAGNYGQSIVTVMVDNTAPSVSLTQPDNGATVSGTVTVATGASDANLARLILTIDGKRVASSTSSTLSYSWKACQTPKKCSGTATLRAEATDHAGNVSHHTITVTRGSK